MKKRARHTCPRRAEMFNEWAHQENQDRYVGGHGLVTQARGCSFCGSMSGEDFIAAIKSGCEVGPTDKDYKAYVIDPAGELSGKVYFQHLDAEQKIEFVELLNMKVVRIGSPGYFYVLPYFIEREKKHD